MGILKRLNQWLLTTSIESKFFESKIRWQLHSILNHILYPEFRKRFNPFKAIYSNRYLLLVIKSILILTFISFIGGYSVNRIYISSLKTELAQRDSLLLLASGKDSMISAITRKYFEYKVEKESKIKYMAQLKDVPDSIFFLMVRESDKYKIPYVIFFRIMERESKFQFVKNSEGSSALGYMQLIKSTFDLYSKKLGINPDHTPGNNVRVAAFMINDIHEFWTHQFKDERTRWEYTIAEYGYGRGPLIKNNKCSIPDSLRGGVNYVMSCYGK